MNLARSSGENFVLELNRREKQMLASVLSLYPLLNPDYHQVAKGSGDKKIEESRKLILEAMADRLRENKKFVAEFLSVKNWKQQADGKFVTELDGEEMDWLLQVLNDVRVGSWVKLGKPSSQHVDFITSAQNQEELVHATAMELCGIFESVLLDALEK